MWPNKQFSADLVTFTEEILNEKLYFLYSTKIYEGFLILLWTNYISAKDCASPKGKGFFGSA